jgi:hypothetical protein
VEIHLQSFVTQLPCCGLTFRLVSGGKHDAYSTASCQLAADLEPDAAVGAGNDRDALVHQSKPLTARDAKEFKKTENKSEPPRRQENQKE